MAKRDRASSLGAWSAAAINRKTSTAQRFFQPRVRASLHYKSLSRIFDWDRETALGGYFPQDRSAWPAGVIQLLSPATLPLRFGALFILQIVLIVAHTTTAMARHYCRRHRHPRLADNGNVEGLRRESHSDYLSSQIANEWTSVSHCAHLSFYYYSLPTSTWEMRWHGLFQGE